VLERGKALMRTRCPVCSTVFRVTTEQLRLKAGKVRCGHCQALFNAFDQLVQDTAAELPPVRAAGASATEPTSTPFESAYTAPTAYQHEPIAPPAVSQVQFEQPDTSLPNVPESAPEAAGAGAPQLSPLDDAAEYLPELEPIVVESMVEPLPAVERLAEPVMIETPEETTLAAREAGLVAARELSDTAGYNRWAAGTLAGNGLGGFDSEPARHPVWPFVVFSLLLAVVLLGQLLFHFRAAVVQRFPDAAAMYALADIDVPLPRNIEQVVIDASDLQSDNQRGLFVLQATLRNRAAFAQAWPALELTLTDTSDAVVSRRVLAPEDYLPPTAAKQKSFAANAELAVRLWIEAKGIGAAGYRLYVFYP